MQVLARLTGACVPAQSVKIPGQCLVKARDVVPHVGSRLSCNSLKRNLQGNSHVLVGRVTVCLPGSASVFPRVEEPSSQRGGMPGKALVCSFPIKELTGGCDTVHNDELVPACQLLHLPWKEEIRCRN